MKKHRVFVTRMIPQAGLDLLAPFCRVEVNPHDKPLGREELLRLVADKHGVIGLLTDHIDAEFFNAAKELKGYANYAVGYDNIDLTEASARKIPVSNTPDVLTRATAELAWALLFATARRIVETDRHMRSGNWDGWGPLQFIGADVGGKTLGIVGPGRIGTAMALMSRGFDMRVVYASSSGRANQVLDDGLGALNLSFDELLRESDFISIHCPLNQGTRHLFNARAFELMKPTAFVLNTARGPVIDEQALVRALKQGEIAGAGLDVYEFEPKMADGLAALDNVVVLPHIGSATVRARTDMAVLAAENLLAMLQGRPPKTCLNPEVLA